MRYEVSLRLHQDDASGEWGLCHANAVGTFNAFWGADGIFHDVFEHYYEDVHPYFKGQNAFQIFGEAAASGHGIAYNDIGINNFMYRSSKPIRDFIADTKQVLEDWVHGHQDYPEYALDSYCLPKQPNVFHASLQYWLNNYHDWINDRITDELPNASLIPMDKIENCYRWGYKRAMKIVGDDRSHAYNVLYSFLERWHRITQQSSASYIAIDNSDYGLKYIRFIVNTVPKLSVKEYLVDDIGHKFSIDHLINY